MFLCVITSTYDGYDPRNWQYLTRSSSVVISFKDPVRVRTHCKSVA